MSKSKTTIAQVTEWFLGTLEAVGGAYIECSICRGYLRPGQRIDWDHTHCEGLDGPHEIGNLRPLHHDCHKTKTKRDVQAMAKADRSNGTTGTRGDKFTPKKLPVDAPRPEKPRFGQRGFKQQAWSPK